MKRTKLMKRIKDNHFQYGFLYEDPKLENFIKPIYDSKYKDSTERTSVEGWRETLDINPINLRENILRIFEEEADLDYEISGSSRDDLFIEKISILDRNQTILSIIKELISYIDLSGFSLKDLQKIFEARI